MVPPACAAAAAAEANGKGNNGTLCGAAVQLADGAIVRGKNSPLMHAASAVVLNAIKHLSRLPDEIHRLAPSVVESIAALKKHILRMGSVSLDLNETLIALAISATASPAAQVAMEKLNELHGREFHTTRLPTPGDEAGLQRLGLKVTSEEAFASRSLFLG